MRPDTILAECLRIAEKMTTHNFGLNNNILCGVFAIAIVQKIHSSENDLRIHTYLSIFTGVFQTKHFRLQIL